MKKDRLYTVNKGNKRALGGNLFAPGGPIVPSTLPKFANYNYGSTQLSDANKKTIGSLGSSTNNSNFFTDNAGALNAVASMASPGLTGVIGGGYSTGGVGEGISAVGNTVSEFLPGPWKWGVKLGSAVVGGLVNRGWGTKKNEKNIASIENNTANMNTVGRVLSEASTTSDLLNGAGSMGSKLGFGTKDLVKGGWFSGGKAKSMGQKYLDAENNALAFQSHGLATGADNVDRKQDSMAMRNFAAFGGPLDIVPSDNNFGAIEYGFMSDYLTAKRRQAEAKNKLGGVGVFNSFGRGGCLCNKFDIGGDIQTQGADYTTGMSHINAGSSHELNPNEGVQVGVDAEGTPNLVEEGETIFNDYVYSARIKCDPTTKEMFHIGKKRDITYAELSKKLEKEAAERPNDPISKAALKVQMQDLAEQQERQKAEMENARVREAFEALTPEEQAEVMNYAQQRDAQEQEAASQEQAKAEQQMMQEAAAQQQPMENMGQPISQEEMMQQQMIAQQQAQAPVQMAMGGNLFPWGGTANLFNVKPPYGASKTAGFIPYTRDLTEEEVLKREQDPVFQAWTKYVNDNWDSKEVQDYLRALDAAAGGNHLFDAQGNLITGNKEKGIMSARDYYNHARTGNHLWGYYHLTPEQIAEAVSPTTITESELRTPREYHIVEGDDDYLEGDSSTWNGVGKEIRRRTLPNGDIEVIHAADASAQQKPADKTGTADEWEVTPNYRNEKLRYAGLFGPAVGLGMQALGIGRPDTSRLDAAVDSYRNGRLALADYRPIGNYLTYRPMDIWAEQNRLNANARATDRALMNNSSPVGTKMAGLLANEYNNQLASGQLYRQAQEYNNNLNERVQTFNRGTDQYNADAYNRTALANAEAINRDRQYRTQLGLQAAAQKMDADAGWYNGIYGNVAGLFKGISDLGRENAQHNMIAEMAADGIFGPMSPRTNTGKRGKYLTFTKKNSACKGGKINRKKG